MKLGLTTMLVYGRFESSSLGNSGNRRASCRQINSRRTANLVNVWTPSSDYHSRTLQLHPCDHILRISCISNGTVLFGILVDFFDNVFFNTAVVSITNR